MMEAIQPIEHHEFATAVLIDTGTKSLAFPWISSAELVAQEQFCNALSRSTVPSCYLAAVSLRRVELNGRYFSPFDFRDNDHISQDLRMGH
ncbi:hypothetical protein TNIN_412591 [Trichonephila inaurata madagascariensis]|uniref:Uncharacterized protein n=1 Tax=Trichonephila inaurata madagascariensis TaxID=2747483 RepID=A0A8X6XIH2_9ARAC|nr:hypothetical protein TNIN_412591 [Trichonephila inaurata madagascariensis]